MQTPPPLNSPSSAPRRSPRPPLCAKAEPISNPTWANGEVGIADLLARSGDPLVGGMKVSAALLALPRVGKRTAETLMSKIGIPENRRLRGLGGATALSPDRGDILKIEKGAGVTDPAAGERGKFRRRPEGGALPENLCLCGVRVASL